jgi:hypothetical protein
VVGAARRAHRPELVERPAETARHEGPVRLPGAVGERCDPFAACRLQALPPGLRWLAPTGRQAPRAVRPGLYLQRQEQAEDLRALPLLQHAVAGPRHL